MKQEGNLKNILLGIGALGPLVAFGWWANSTLNTKADATDLKVLQTSVSELNKGSAVITTQYTEVIRRLDNIEAQQSEIAKALHVPVASTTP